jgi:hypothetical protein
VRRAPRFQMEVAVAGELVLRKRGIGLGAPRGQPLKLKKVASTERMTCDGGHSVLDLEHQVPWWDHLLGDLRSLRPIVVC